MKEMIDKTETLNVIRSFISSLRPEATGLISEIYDAVLHIHSADQVQHEYYCDRNICAKNEANGISCRECEVLQND